MNAGIESCVVAFALSVSLTPLVRRFAIRFGLFDPPGPLKIHRQPIPRLGGIAIASGIAVGCSLTKPLASPGASVFLAALAIVWSAGLIDDLRGLSPTIRMVCQAAAALLLWRGGWHFPAIANSGWNAAATCALVIFFINAFNFLDGSDGLAAGVAGTVALSFAFLQSRMAGTFGSGIAWSLLGAATGFLVFNAPLPRASIFMGDSGSTALGFSIAVLSLNLSRFAGGTASSLFFPVLAAALPLFDAGLAILRRIRCAQSPFKGDRFHYYDLLRMLSWSARKVALVSCIVTFVLGAVGWAAFQLQPELAALLTAATFASLLVVAARLGSLRAESSFEQFHGERPRMPTTSREAEVTMWDWTE